MEYRVQVNGRTLSQLFLIQEKPQNGLKILRTGVMLTNTAIQEKASNAHESIEASSLALPLNLAVKFYISINQRAGLK